MNYLVTAVAVAVLYALQIVGEKLFMEDSPGITNSTLTFLTTGFLAVFSLVLIPFVPIDLNPSTQLLGIFLLIGFMYTLSMVLWFYAMARENASKVGQLASLEAIVTSAFGVLFFSESPSVIALIAIGLIILGIFSLVFDRGVARAVVTTKVAVIPILLTVVLWAVQDSLINYVTMEETFWTVFFWIRIISFGFFVPLIIRPVVRTEVVDIIFNNYSDFSLAFWAAKIASAFGLVLSVYSISKGPLSIVGPIVASYPIFVLLFGLIATRYTNITIEQVDRTHILKRMFSLVLFITGMALLFFH